MSWMEMADVSAPVTPPPPTPVQAFYAGGQTPHPWTDEDLRTIKARWAVPIWVNVHPEADPAAFATGMVDWLHRHHYKPGELVVIDTESTAMAAFVAELDDRITAAGFKLAEYESKGPVGQNPATSGGRWVADWTGVPHMFPGAIATQYADSAMAGLPWDQDVIDDGIKLHEQNPPVIHTIPYVAIQCDVPVLVTGDRGQAVARMQGLLEAWEKGATGPDGIDGLFGPNTESALRRFLRMHGRITDAGRCDGPAWELLITA